MTQNWMGHGTGSQRDNKVTELFSASAWEVADGQVSTLGRKGWHHECQGRARVWEIADDSQV